MTNELFAQSINMDAGQLSGVKTGKYNLTLQQVFEINSKYNVRIGWLLEGEEPIFKNEKSGSLQMPDSLLTHLKTLQQSLQISLHKLEEIVPYPEPEEENSDQGAAYSEFRPDKSRKADKR